MQLSNELVFNSIHELTDELDASKHQPGRYHSSNQDGERGHWCDTKNYEEARKYLEIGKIVDGLECDIEKYRTEGHATKRVNKLDVVGHNVVVPLYLQGIPQCMMQQKRVINNKIVNIFYSCDAPCYASSKELIDGATTLFKNIINLEENGYRVNLYIIQCQESKWGYCVRIKTDRETFNIKKLCFPLVSSSMLRRIGFRIKENLYKDWIGCGYGSATFNKDYYDSFIRRKLKINKYEMWNYQGKKYSK